MNDREPCEDLRLPEELRALHEELSSIRYEERPSFAPELWAELENEALARPHGPSPLVRYLAAAALAGLLVAGVAVPSARASLIRLLSLDRAPVESASPAQPAALTPPPVAPASAPALAEEGDGAEVEPAEVVASTAVEPTPLTPPRMLDRERAERLLEDAYPVYMQNQGVGGLVWLRAWVDRNGLAGLAEVSRTSGIAELDRAALQVVPLLRFTPAMQSGEPIETWIEFSILFEPEETEPRTFERTVDDALRLPEVRPSERWERDDALELAALPEWDPAYDPGRRAAEGALAEAIGGSHLDHIGPVRSILAGLAPDGHAPTVWRAETAKVLEAAVERDPMNPAPLLALGRIRLRQGLRTDARTLFERGLQIAIGGESSAPAEIVAELHYERGRLVRDNWLATHAVGRVRAAAFEGARCATARPAGTATHGYASVERLIAWNYLCPMELARIFRSGFEARVDDGADLSLMMASFRAALDEAPGHVGSNVALLLTLAEAGAWGDVLAGARRFARRSLGHPDALLLTGLALHELGDSESAARHFAAALARLPQSEAEAVRDVTPVLDPIQRADYRRLGRDERGAWEAAYWAAKDRSPGTAVNEREVEHLARSAYVHLRYGGSTSDAGEVWVRFGGPNTIHIVDAGSGQLTEFWDYGSGPDITFARRVASQAMDLTPEGRAYVDDLGSIFPPQ